MVRAALAWAGARAVQLQPGDAVDADSFDGFVVTGGHDVEPALYQAVAEVEGNYDAERDRFELHVLGLALAAHKPVMGICRGAQLLNVCRGGTLVQDLKPHRTRTSQRRTILPLKRVVMAAGSRLERWLGEQARVNSLHRQAVDTVGDGLVVTGRDEDGIVQGVELAGEPYTLGVQWHPELLLCSRRQRRLFGALVEAALAARSDDLAAPA